MFTSKFFLGLLLLSCPLIANTPAQFEPTEEQVAQMMEQMEEFVAMVQQVGGLYIVAVGEIPQHKKMAAYHTMKTAAEQKLKAALEKLGCQTELIEMPAE